MKKRLIWNFEIDPKPGLNYPSPDNTTPDLHWEARFFWPQTAIVLLTGLDESFLNLAQYQSKTKHDVYFLLPETNYNIKLRREVIVFKPLLKRAASATAFGKKIKLDENATHCFSSGEDGLELNSSTLLQQIRSHAKKVTVDKEALVYRFPALPDTKLELARLRINREVFFSVSIESTALNVVETLSKQLVNREDFSDYIGFLKAHCS